MLYSDRNKDSQHSFVRVGVFSLVSLCASLAEVVPVAAEPKGAFLIKGRSIEEKTLYIIAITFRLFFTVSFV